MDRTPSPASTYCSFTVGRHTSPIRRSQRLIDKENRDLPKIPANSRSPQLFGDTQEEYSQLLCQQEKIPTKIVHLEEELKSSHKLVHMKSADKVVPLKPLNKIIHTIPQDKIIHLQAEVNNLEEDVDEPPRKSRKRNHHAKPKNRVPKEPAKRKPKNRNLTAPDVNLKNSISPSKLPSQYPPHFVHQLPLAEDDTVIPIRPLSAPAAQLRDSCLTPMGTRCGIWDTSPSILNSEISLNISLSESMEEIFGTRNIHDILAMQKPRQYILIEDHLPTVASMLNVSLERLRSVLEITQGWTHDQFLHFPIKQEMEDVEDQSN
ncbi:meiotic recombination protein P22 [Drosophila ficusphila]|uniref:meiotic recombination protein P22 n=1 Tax=Drosophila ficusphila TaxID=30025 RepID=UPI001C89118A|nr:meiotic recombination protein P22 [Drosophila ficusphila]